MKKVLPNFQSKQSLRIVLASAVIVSTAYLTPLYPIYAQGLGPAKVPPARALNAASAPAMLKPEGLMEKMEMTAEKRMEMLKERIATRSAALKQKLARFRDKTKAARLENINENLNTVNMNVTAALQKNLDNISSALERLKTKAAEAAAEGKDLTNLNSDIAEVESEWAEANEALKAQMEKDYTVALTSESTAKTDAQAARNTLRTDLKSVHAEIMEARTALADAVKNALSSL